MFLDIYAAALSKLQCNEELAIAMKSEDMLAKCTDSKSALNLAYS